MRFGMMFGNVGATTTWAATTETKPMASSDATSAFVTTESPSTTESVGTTDAVTTTTTTTTIQLFREELLLVTVPAGKSFIARQKSVQAAQQNATLNGNSRNISRNSHKLRVNMKGKDQRVKVDGKKLTRPIIRFNSQGTEIFPFSYFAFPMLKWVKMIKDIQNINIFHKTRTNGLYFG